jgi:hypothetical protein
MIEVTRKTIVRDLETHYAEEITSFDQLSPLKIGTPVAIMTNCDMVIGRIMYKEPDFIMIDVVTGTVSVQRSSFSARNYLYRLIEQVF